MSCGLVNEDDVRSIPIREDVPWHSLDEVKLVGKRHGDRLFWLIEHYALGAAQPPIAHSVWHSQTSARSFLHVNSGQGQGAGQA